MAEDIDVALNVDTEPLETAFRSLERLSDSFGRQLTGALKSAVAGGKELDDILRRIGLNLAGMALQEGLKPLQNLAGSLFSGLFSGIMPFAKGGVPGQVVPFADGGVVSAPTFFPLGRSVGLMGEAGPEAILPLQRGSDGRLGVATSGGGAPVNVTFNVTTPDAQSFRRSEGQISGMLARAVARGSRSL